MLQHQMHLMQFPSDGFIPKFVRPIRHISIFLFMSFLALPMLPIQAGSDILPVPVDVFVGDKMLENVANPEGYHTFRIPALIRAANGDLLAFCEGRRDNEWDEGKIDIVMKRSTDDGATWGPLQVVHGLPDQLDADGKIKEFTVGNPVPIVDGKNGIIHLLFSLNNRKGVFSMRSVDHGHTWTTPEQINLVGNSAPEGASAMPPVDFAAWTKVTGVDVERFGTGPGHGLRCASGRLVAPIWFRGKLGGAPYPGPALDPAILQEEGLAINRKHRFFAGVLLSDDDGRSWRIGGLAPEGSNESTITQLPDGSLLMTSRFEAGHYRVVSRSYDEGETFSNVTLDRTLIDPACQGSILFWNGPGNQDLILSTNIAVKALGLENRSNLTLRTSADGGASWSDGQVIDPGLSAYSDMAPLKDGSVGILYERGRKDYHDRISFVRITPGL